jgi:thiol-disulfide isomerase/thioredoxin
MRHSGPLVFLTACLITPSLAAQATESSITDHLKNLRSVSAEQRPAATAKLAADINTLPAGQSKVKLADALAHLSTEGDPGKDTLQAVTNTLAQALTESPVAPKNDHVPEPYMEVAKLVRYEQLTTSLKDPQFDKASQLLEANDADIEKADFTLKDLRGKKYTLSELRGKIVLVNFWATWCPPCRSEMPNLDAIYTHFQSQGLEILSISVDEDPLKMTSFMSGTNYHPPVLYDAGGKVAKQFHVDGLPRTFVFNRDGKLIAQSIDMRTQRQFFNMLAAAGLHP